MQKKRTRRFRIVWRSALAFSAGFLIMLALLMKTFAAQYFDLLTDCVFCILALAAVSFLSVCFAPYFRGDRRWYAIPALLTVVFFASVILLWQVPLSNGTVL